MSVFYKYKCAKDYSTIFFDGPFISQNDLTQQIIHQQKLNRRDFDLEVIDAQTQQVFDSESCIPKNISLIVRRIPKKKSRINIFIENADRSPPATEKEASSKTCRKDIIYEGGEANLKNDSIESTFMNQSLSISTSLNCPLCKQLITDAVLITCCGNSFCKQCINPDTDEIISCPICKRINGPSKIVPNHNLRNMVHQFLEQSPLKQNLSPGATINTQCSQTSSEIGGSVLPVDLPKENKRKNTETHINEKRIKIGDKSEEKREYKKLTYKDDRDAPRRLGDSQRSVHRNNSKAAGDLGDESRASGDYHRDRITGRVARDSRDEDREELRNKTHKLPLQIDIKNKQPYELSRPKTGNKINIVLLTSV